MESNQVVHQLLDAKIRREDAVAYPERGFAPPFLSGVKSRYKYCDRELADDNSSQDADLISVCNCAPVRVRNHDFFPS